jgi:hypothetical protein
MTRPSWSPIGMTRAPSNLGWLDVQQVVDPSVGELPFEDVEGGQLACFLHSQAAGQQQLQQCPVPERGDHGYLGGAVAGTIGDGLLRLVPTAQRERANVGDLALQVQHQAGGVGFAALAGLLEPDVKQVVAGQWHHCGDVAGERRVRLGPPRADVGEERPHGDQPRGGGQPVIAVGADPGPTTHRPGPLNRVGHEPASVPRDHVAAGGDVWVVLAQVAPEVANRDQFVFQRGVSVGDPSGVGLQVQRGHGLEVGRNAAAGNQFRRAEPPRAPMTGRAAQRRAVEDAQRAQRHVENVSPTYTAGQRSHVVVGAKPTRHANDPDQLRLTDSGTPWRECQGRHNPTN